MIEQLHIGQPLVLEVPTDGRQDMTPFQSRLMAVDDDALIAAIPKLQGRSVALPEGTPVHVVITQEDAIYDFDSSVLGEWDEFPPALKLELPGRIRRTQRRDFVRVAAEIPLVILARDGFRMETKTWDLSGSGLSFLHTQPLAGEFTLILHLPKDGAQGELIEASGVVKRQQHYGSRCLVGVTFTTLLESDREKIIAFLFKRMRELRSRD